MRRMALITALFCLACCLAGCGNERTVSTESGLESASGSKPAAHVMRVYGRGHCRLDRKMDDSI